MVHGERIGVGGHVQTRRLLVADRAAQHERGGVLAIGADDVGALVDEIFPWVDAVGVGDDVVEVRLHTCRAYAGEGVSALFERLQQRVPPRMAHLMRTGNFTTPCRASRSPSFTDGSGSIGLPSSSGMLIRPLKRRTSARTSSTGLPFMAWLIMLAELCEMLQPWPPTLTSVMMPSSTSR